MPQFSEVTGAHRLAMGIENDRIVFDHVNDLRVRNYLDPDGGEHRDCWLKLGKDYDGIEFVYMKFERVRSLAIDKTDRIAGLTLERLDDGTVELKSDEVSGFHVVCAAICFID